MTCDQFNSGRQPDQLARALGRFIVIVVGRDGVLQLRDALHERGGGRKQNRFWCVFCSAQCVIQYAWALHKFTVCTKCCLKSKYINRQNAWKCVRMSKTLLSLQTGTRNGCSSAITTQLLVKESGLMLRWNSTPRLVMLARTQSLRCIQICGCFADSSF